MSDGHRKQFDIRIELLTEPQVDDVAAMHRICFPEKVESHLGHACVREVYLERFFGSNPDTFCLVAVHEPDGRMAGFACGSNLVPQSSSPHSFINKRLLVRHLLKRIWFSPAIWKWLFYRYRTRSAEGHSEGRVVPIPPWGMVVKLVGVHPDFRGGNVGVGLMTAIEEEAKKRGARRLYLLVERSNVKAERLYASVGWARTSPATAGWKIFSMQKDLCPNLHADTPVGK